MTSNSTTNMDLTKNSSKYLVLFLALILTGHLTLGDVVDDNVINSQENSNVGEDVANLRLRKEIVAAMKDTLKQKEIIQYLQREFGLSDMDWSQLTIKHDKNGDRELSEEEFLELTKELVGWHDDPKKKKINEPKKTTDQENMSRKNINTTAIYTVMAVVGGYLMYLFWKHWQESQEARQVPEQDSLRTARLAKLGTQTTPNSLEGGEDQCPAQLRHRGTTSRQEHDACNATTEPAKQMNDLKHMKLIQENSLKSIVQEKAKPKDFENAKVKKSLNIASPDSNKENKNEIAKEEKIEEFDTELNKEKKNMEGISPVQIKDERPLEDQVKDALCKAFNMSMKQFSERFRLTPSDLPATASDVSEKIHILYRRASAYQRSKQISFCVRCYESSFLHACEGQHKVVKSVLEHLQEEAVKMVVDLLIEDAKKQYNSDDDFWEQFSEGQGSHSSKTSSEFMSCVAGMTDQDNILRMSDSFLKAILLQAQETTDGCRAVGVVIHSTAKYLKKCPRIDEMRLERANEIFSLERLLGQATLIPVMQKILEAELQNSSTALGAYFENDCVLGPLLSLTTVPSCLLEGILLHNPMAKPWVTLTGFPKVRIDELQSLEFNINTVILRLRSMVFHLLKGLVKAHPQTTLAWLACLLSANEMREGASAKIRPEDVSHDPACSDGFMLNLVPVLLEFCLPFCQGDLVRLGKVNPLYPASPACRLNYHFESCLAGGQIVLEEEEGESGKQTGTIPKHLQGSFNFMTEIFHLTLRAFHVGFFTSLTHFEQLQKILAQNLSVAKSQSQAAEADMERKRVLFALRWDCSLLEPTFLRWGTQFYLTTAKWIMMVMQGKIQGVSVESERDQHRIMAQVPEFIVKDMSRWFWLMATHGILIHPDATVGIELSPFVDSCVTLLRRPDIMPGPIPAYRIAQALLAFVQTSKRQDRGSRGWGSGLTSEWAAIVHTCPAAVDHLGPALLHTYVSVDVVEGLDVDKEDFDKYGARAEIGSLLANLWQRDDCRESVLKLCGTTKFQNFLGAVLDTLLHQLHDSLARLSNVRKLQQAKDDETSWRSLSLKEKEDKERFFQSEQMAAKGFMNMSNRTLSLIDLISRSPDVAACFTVMPLSQRAASAFLGFIEAFCGVKATELKVKDMEKYSFNPRQLLSQIIEILLRVVEKQNDATLSFISSMATDPDYSADTLEKASSVIHSKDLLSPDKLQEFKAMLEEMSLLHEALQQDQASGVGGTEHQHQWQIDAQSTKLDPEELEKQYTTALNPYMYQTAELEEFHSFQSNASQSYDPRSQRAKSLMREMKQWGENLPIHPHAAVYVCQDEERMDLVRALVTGPVDTPYSLGCFVFDIYFPSNYPNIPPLVKLITTGNGTVRFNPNLYADGKVCLSLLGTWHSGDSSQKWQPNKSSLYQVLVSIQSMILIADPMYNEPGYEGIQGTSEGEAQSLQYNKKIRLWTVRHAMLGQLQNPPAGFASVIKHHFRIQCKAILQQCSSWLGQCGDKEEERKLRVVVDELHQELIKLDQEPQD